MTDLPQTPPASEPRPAVLIHRYLRTLNLSHTEALAGLAAAMIARARVHLRLSKAQVLTMVEMVWDHMPPPEIEEP